MSKVITYKEGCYSQIKLTSGERIMLSIARTGIVIFKMRFFGVYPGPKIAEWLPHDLHRFRELFGGGSLNPTPLKLAVEKLISFDSISELREFLNKEPHDA